MAVAVRYDLETGARQERLQDALFQLKRLFGERWDEDYMVELDRDPQHVAERLEGLIGEEEA